MPQPPFDSESIFGIHDPGGESVMAGMERHGWIVFSEAIGASPLDGSGKDFSPWSGKGFGVVCQLQYSYGTDGTIPSPSEYDKFAQQVAAYVTTSSGCKTWVIGNEMNSSQEWPVDRGAAQFGSQEPNAPPTQRPSKNNKADVNADVSRRQIITPDLYARCFKLCRDAIKAIPEHADDLVVVGAVALWNADAKYQGNEEGDWVIYFADILALLGPGGCDGIALHTYTHGDSPDLITDSSKMNPPFQDRHYNFLAYRDLMAAIPTSMRRLPVYITETHPDAEWPGQPNGWIQQAYAEIDRWNHDSGNQRIRALVLYRWQNVDRWFLNGNEAVLADFRDAMRNDYRWNASQTIQTDSTVGAPETVNADQPALYIPPSPGYVADYVDPNATMLMDRLDIEQEVTTIAHVLMSGQVQPPLSLGLFGDWGSGKTFFMTSLKNRIDDVARHYRVRERQTNQRSDWCTRVVQITFNAWHFSDANLWASIVTRIYDELDRTLKPEQPSDEELRQNLGKQIQSAQGMVRQTESEVELAKGRVGDAEAKLRETRAQLRDSQQTVSGLIDDLGVLLRENEPVRNQLDAATSALGYPTAAESYSSLVELHASLQTISGRTSALAISLVRAPWTLLVLAGLIIGLPLILSWAMTQFADSIGAVGRSVVEISTVVFALVAWLQRQIGSGLTLIGSVESALADAQAVRDKRINEDKAVQDARKSLLEAEASEKAARDNLVIAQAELQRLERELQELRPERKLFKLIEERSQSAAYSKHLGIVSLIRSDFEQMSVLLARMKEEDRNLTNEEPPIQRIILYIDDLDRCRPERVVEVLEAIHLLLAFPLFVVVVGVDPRWLRHSLAYHYSHTLEENTQPGNVDTRVGPAFYSTPQDYLEKIFQIPYALRPIDRVGFTSLVTDLLKPLPSRVTKPVEPSAVDSNAGQNSMVSAIEPTSAPTDGEVRPAGQTVQDRQKQPVALRPGSEHENSPAEAGASNKPTDHSEPTFTPLNPAQLEFKAWEEEDMYRLWPLFRTPRSAKRFVNIYRLLRASLTSDQVVMKFVGTPEQRGEYQLVLVLLAVTAAAPNQTMRFLGQIRDSLESNPRLDGDASTWNWKGFFDHIPSRVEGSMARKNLTTRQTTDERQRPPRNDEASSLKPDDGSDKQAERDEAWDTVIERVRLITLTGSPQAYSNETVRFWTTKVARYSFSLSTAEEP